MKNDNNQDAGVNGGNEEKTDLIRAVNDASILLLDTDIETFAEDLFKAMGIIALAVDVDRVYIWKNHIIGERLYCSQVYEWSENVTPQQDNEFTANILYSDVAPDWEEILSNDKSINSLVCEMTPETRDHLMSQGVVSILVVPVFMDGGFWGFVGFDDCHNERVFNTAEEMILRSSSLLFTHAYQKNEISRKIEDNNEFNRVMFASAPIGLTIFDNEFNLFDCNNAVLSMYGGIPKDYYLNNFFEFSPEYQPDGVKSTEKIYDILNKAINGERIRAEWMHRSQSDEHIPCEITLANAKIGNKQVVLAYTYDLRRVKELEIDLDRVRNQAYTDSLTGIYNRRYFEETIKHIMNLLSRTDAHLSILMLDIDYFKQYNDTYGHHEGDNCLKKVAEILSDTLSRDEDFVARYGGEEFIIALPNTDEPGACVVAERLLKNVRNANILHEKSKAADHVTLSVGVASGKIHHTQTKESYIILADEMLYASKQNGRNRCSSAKLL